MGPPPTLPEERHPSCSDRPTPRWATDVHTPARPHFQSQQGERLGSNQMATPGSKTMILSISSFSQFLGFTKAHYTWTDVWKRSEHPKDVGFPAIPDTTLFPYMCVCTLACVRHTSVYRCRPEGGIRHRPRLCSSLRQNLVENLELVYWLVYWLACPSKPASGSTGYVGAGGQTPVLFCLHNTGSTHWAISPAPFLYFNLNHQTHYSNKQSKILPKPALNFNSTASLWGNFHSLCYIKFNASIFPTGWEFNLPP